ncbi:MAG TPA: hypothetical protein VJZ72_01140 [Candidatus Limnocylindrales bacterium]|nr:hypothetical protein [Candidatus Limnocylindrales bacterium]
MDNHRSWVFSIVIALGLVAFVGLPLASGFAAVIERGSDRVDVDDTAKDPDRRHGPPPWAMQGRREMKRDQRLPGFGHRPLRCWMAAGCRGGRDGGDEREQKRDKDDDHDDRGWPDGAPKPESKHGPKPEWTPDWSPVPSPSSSPEPSPTASAT